jgi:polysaccharide deacetylase family protein (PEP-CTERM system associated)
MPPDDGMKRGTGSGAAGRMHGGVKTPNGVVCNGAMTVDVEDYFQVGAFAKTISRDDWDGLPRRVEANTDRVLTLFDAAGIKATFFTLGWVAERYPGLIRRIVDQGHELASHGFEHRRVDSQDVDAFRADIGRTRRLLEDTGGVKVIGFRAASFSLGPTTPWAHIVLAEEGYRYSSSVFPVRHDHYGTPNAPRRPHYPAGSDGVVELPMSTCRLLGRNFPCSGGGYFRMLPYPISRWALRRVTESERVPAVFYFHPWEIDPDQPRQSGISAKVRFRHYVNLHAMEAKLKLVFDDFTWNRMDRVFPEIAEFA